MLKRLTGTRGVHSDVTSTGVACRGGNGVVDCVEDEVSDGRLTHHVRVNDAIPCRVECRVVTGLQDTLGNVTGISLDGVKVDVRLRRRAVAHASLRVIAVVVRRVLLPVLVEHTKGIDGDAEGMARDSGGCRGGGRGSRLPGFGSRRKLTLVLVGAAEGLLVVNVRAELTRYVQHHLEGPQIVTSHRVRVRRLRLLVEANAVVPRAVVGNGEDLASVGERRRVVDTLKAVAGTTKEGPIVIRGALVATLRLDSQLQEGIACGRVEPTLGRQVDADAEELRDVPDARLKLILLVEVANEE